MSKRELIVLLAHHQADPGLSTDLAALAGKTTDDLPHPQAPRPPT